MTPFALILVLTAAVLHAVWNLWAKRAGGGLPFVYLVGLIICTLYLPVAGGYWLWRAPEIPWSTGLWIIGSGVLKTSYALFLQRSYRTGDFSLIYPLARGTGPLLSTLAAILILGERPSALAVGGSLIIVTSIFFLTGGTAFTQLALLIPFALRRWPEVQICWRTQRRYACGVALLSPVAYVLVLTALSFTPVSYIAPAREVSIIIGAFLGAKVLKEADGSRRVWGDAALAVGVIARALG